MSIFPQAVAEAGLSTVKALPPSKTYQLDFLSPSVLDTVYEGDTPPANPTIGEYWRDTGSNPSTIRGFTGEDWAEKPLYLGLPIIDGETAIRQAIHKAILTNMHKSSIYDGSYGSELESLIGSNHSPAYLQSEIPRMIREAIIYDDRIADVSEMAIKVSGDLVYVEFTVTGTDGAILQIMEALNV